MFLWIWRADECGKLWRQELVDHLCGQVFTDGVGPLPHEEARSTAASIIGFIADVTTPANLAIRIICTDKGGELQGHFQQSW